MTYEEIAHQWQRDFAGKKIKEVTGTNHFCRAGRFAE